MRQHRALDRSLSDLVGLLGELQSRDMDLYLRQQALDTTKPSGRALFGKRGMFSDFERAMIRDRMMAGLSCQGIWQTPGQAQDDAVRRAAYRRVRETARHLKVSQEGLGSEAHVGDRKCATLNPVGVPPSAVGRKHL